MRLKLLDCYFCQCKLIKSLNASFLSISFFSWRGQILAICPSGGHWVALASHLFLISLTYFTVVLRQKGRKEPCISTWTPWKVSRRDINKLSHPESIWELWINDTTILQKGGDIQITQRVFSDRNSNINSLLFRDQINHSMNPLERNLIWKGYGSSMN